MKDMVMKSGTHKHNTHIIIVLKYLNKEAIRLML